jgi:hypothetical protein
MATITNINGTSDTTCKCGSWLKHWQNFSRQSLPSTCPVLGCFQSDLVGAHVQKANSLNQKWYIIPLCKGHNASSSNLTVSDSVNFVSANKSETCG